MIRPIGILIMVGALAACSGNQAQDARIAELEAEVRALQAQLAQSKAKPTELVPAASAPMSQSDAAKALATPPPDAAAFDGRFAVHLASYRNIKDAPAGWRSLQQKYPALKGMEARLSPVDLGPGKGRFYRLKAGPLADQNQATALCAKLKAAGQSYCNPTDFGGTAVGG